MPAPEVSAAADKSVSTGAIIGGVAAVVVVSAVAGIWAWQTSWSPSSDGAAGSASGTGSVAGAPGSSGGATAKAAAGGAATSGAGTKGSGAKGSGAKGAGAKTAAPKAKPAPAKAAAAEESVGACVATLLPADAFGDKVPDMSGICQARDPFRGSLRIKTELVKVGGRNVTNGMREWSKLGWYEMAAFATIRGHCCEAPAKLVGPTMVRPCKLDEALAALGSRTADPEGMKEATQAFGKAADCIARAGGASAFDQEGSPAGGEVKYFEQILSRLPN